MKRRTFLASAAGTGFLTQSQLRKPVNRAMKNPSQTKRTIIQGRPGQIDASRLDHRNQNRSTMVSCNGVAASSQYLASQVGLQVLKDGGNAVDAAIAMNAMLSVVEPQSCGPGGDLFAIAWIEKEQKLFGLNASGRSPYAWNIEEAKKRGYTAKLPVYGPLAWSVPGCVSGWDALHTFFGKTKFADLMAPAAHYADEGFVLTEIIAQSFEQADKTFEKFPNAHKTFTQNGKTARFGQLFRNPDIAAFFKILMRDGAQAFYKGEIADRIVKYAQERDGLFTRKDFTEHNPTWVEPVGTSYRGHDVWELPPNGQGIAALQMMNILEAFDIAALQPNSAEHIHLFLEAKKLAFEDRATYYGDPDKAEVPVDWLISKEYGKERAKRIHPKQAMKNVRPGVWDGSQDTVYLCASDAEGNMVSLIQSIYYGWGSREVPTGLGFCLQNRGHSFHLNPNHPNSLQPHKRPFHTIIPGFLTQNGSPKCAFGVMGGDFQPQGHAQVLMNIIDFNLSMQQAGEQPRARHFGSSSPNGDVMENGGSFGLEKGLAPSVPTKLQEMGHEPREVNQGRHGGYQAIWREDNPRRYFAGSDPRKDGCAIGY